LSLFFLSSFFLVVGGVAVLPSVVLCLAAAVLARLRSVAANPTGRSGNGCVPLYWQYPEEAGKQGPLLLFFFFFFWGDFSCCFPLYSRLPLQ
jgi:hypothetical protein